MWTRPRKIQGVNVLLDVIIIVMHNSWWFYTFGVEICVLTTALWRKNKKYILNLEC